MQPGQTRYQAPVPGAACGPCISLNFRRVHGYFVVALLAGFISKVGVLYLAFSADDYMFALPTSVQAHTFVSQGRGLALLMMLGLQAFGLTASSIQLPMFFVSLASVAWLVAVSVDLVADDRVAFSLAAACAAVIASHPYLSSYYLFRMAIINHAVTYALVAIALMALTHRGWHLAKAVLISGLIIAIACNANQMALLLYVVVGAAWAISFTCRQFENANSLRELDFRPVMLLTVSALISAILYFIVSSGIKKALHIASVAEYTPHLSNGLTGLITSARALGVSSLFMNEAIFPSTLKWLCLAMGVVAALMTFPWRWQWMASGLLFLACGIVVSIFPMMVSWGGYVPRTFSTLGAVFGLTFIFFAHGTPYKIHGLLAGGLCVLAVFFSMSSGAVFFQQKILSDWDQSLARSIYSDARTNGFLGHHTTLRIAATWPVHGETMPTGYGINESAFLYDWAYKDLFMVATGEDVNVTGAPAEACASHPRWPDKGYLFREQNGDVYACIR